MQNIKGFSGFGKRLKEILNLNEKSNYQYYCKYICEGEGNLWRKYWKKVVKEILKEIFETNFEKVLKEVLKEIWEGSFEDYEGNFEGKLCKGNFDAEL